MIPLSLHSSLTGKDLNIETAGILQKLQGNDEASVLGVSDSREPEALTVVFVSQENHLQECLLKASVIVADEKLASFNPQLSNPETQVLFLTKSLRMAMARLLPLFDRPARKPEAKIHPTASVDGNAKLAEGVIVEARAVIGEGARIGKGAWIQAGAVIEDYAIIGAFCRVQANAVVGRYCELGDRCQIGPGTVIGSDGFGFTDNQKGPPQKIPQVGSVKIGSDVEFGAQCAVDRGTLTATLIGSGCKFDNLCHVAHNCELGPNGLYAGGFFVAGSSKIGAHFMCGGTVAISDHVSICDNVILGGRATVTKDITEAGAYTGYPLQKIKEGLRTIASLPSVPELRDRVQILEEKLASLKALER